MPWSFLGLSRIDVLECWSVLAEEYGLYGIVARMSGMGFRPRPSLCHLTLSEDQKFYYEAHRDLADKTGAYSRKLGER